MVSQYGFGSVANKVHDYGKRPTIRLKINFEFVLKFSNVSGASKVHTKSSPNGKRPTIKLG